MSAQWTRRELVQAALAGLAVGACGVEREPAVSDAPAYEKGKPLPWRNWAGNEGCRPAARVAPASEEEMAALLARAERGVRPVGAGHSFTPLVPTDGTLVASDFLHGVVSADAASLQAEVWAGTRLHALGPLLEAEGLALANLPDIDYQTLGGAVATSTHGTGHRFGSLSSMVVGLTLATPAGELLECAPGRNEEVFHAARCSLGALGVVTRVRLQCQPPVRLVETSRFEPLEDVLAEVEKRRDANRHFEFYALPHSSLAIHIETNVAGPDATPAGEDDPEGVYALRDAYASVGRVPWLGDFLYDRAVHSAASAGDARRVGPSWAVLTHPRMVRFKEMEYTVPAEAGPACLREILAAIRDRPIPVVFPIEYRYVKRDDVWLSQFHARDGCSISIHQYADEDHRAYFDAIEPIFWKHEGRPHFGKIHSLDASRLASLYPRWRDFLDVRRTLDPDGRLLNPHLRQLFGDVG
jgi:FAD-linked oxidoreductase